MIFSSNMRVLLFIILLLSAGTVSASVGKEIQITNTGTDESNSEIISKVYSLQIPFTENKGQIDENVRFYVDTFAGTVFITDKGEIVYSLTKTGEESQETKAIVIRESLRSPKESEVQGINKAETRVNYFLGDKDRWKTDIPTWQEVSMGEVYEGIELKIKAYGNTVEKLFTVHPQGSVSDIKLKIEGSKGLKVSKDGELEIETELGTVKFTKPVAYQEINGNRVEVAVAYTISQSEYGFWVGDYDRSKTLIIDPVLVYSTYLGGSDTELGYGIAVDSSGNMYITGKTLSTNFPTASPYQGSNAGDYDIFITKINATGTGLVYSTYLGGSGSDSTCGGNVIDSSGNVYVTGFTYSADFPTTASAFQKIYAGDRDGYVTKINATGNGLVYSTYLSGSGFDWPCGWAITIDSSGNAYVVMETNSTDLPTNASSYQENYGGGLFDAFVAKINPSGSALVYSTYLGGSSTDASWAIVVDSSGNAYVSGFTTSTDFPTESPYQGSYGGGVKDVFVAKINPSGSALIYSTYLGGSGEDYSHGLAIDSSGNAYVTGKTKSTNFPTASSFQGSNAGNFDVFVTKINATGNGLVYSTYLGGSDYDFGYGMVVDSFGNAHLTGWTRSTNFPTTASAFQGSHAGGIRDVFVTGINATGNGLIYSTYLGGSSGRDLSYDIALDSSGNVYVIGKTESTDFPTASPLYGSNAGDWDVFVTKIDLAPVIKVMSPLNQSYITTQVELNVTASESATWWYSLNSGANVTFTPNTTITPSTGSNNLVVYANDSAGNIVSASVSFTKLETHNISLIPGWNMISIPLEQDNWSIPWVLNSIWGNYTDIYAYVNGTWYWDTSLLPFFILTEMAIDRGYWINMSTAETLELNGTLPLSTTINVVPKWNLVGYPSFTTRPITTVLSPISYTDVYTYINGMWFWDTSLLPFFVLTEVTTGQGYWINATAVGSYVVNP